MIGQDVPAQDQLDVLEITLRNLNHLYHHKKLKIPLELPFFGFKTHGDLSLLYRDILYQMYKIHNAKPGEIISLTSMVAASFGVSMYGTQDSNGNFQIILDKNGKHIQIQALPIQPWEPMQSLVDRMQYFEKHPPAHLQHYYNHNIQSYSQAIQLHEKAIQKIYLGETLEITSQSVPGQIYPIKIIKSSPSEFTVLIETSNPKEPFIRLDSSQKSVWRNHKGAMLDDHSISFLASIDKANEQLKNNRLPPQLAELIKVDDLEQIYNYIASHPLILTKLNSGQSFRLPKELSRLARTVNVVREPSGELMLMLETKRKLASGAKDVKRTIGKGTFGTVKPSWRIDTLIPEEWVNKVMKSSYVKEADYEALFSQSLLQSRDDPNQNVLNVSMLGELFTSKGVVKRSQYSKRAVGDLLSVMSNPNIDLTPKDKDRITQNILDALAVMHETGKIHQDLKLPNIFIYQDEEGYYAKVADFGISYNPNLPTKKPSLASGGYESPEIMSANESPDASYHKYFYNDAFIQMHSYAYQFHMSRTNRNPDSPESLEFRNPHPANDMWAVGIVLFELQYGAMPRFGFSIDEQRIERNPLLKGLLNPNRADRLNIQQALEQYHKTQPNQTRAVTREQALAFAKPTIPKPKPLIAAEPIKPTINYKAIIGVQFLNLGNIEGPNGRIQRDIYISTLKKAYDNDQKLFNLTLESQTLADLERLQQSLARYLMPPEMKVLLYPELLQALDVKLNEKVQSIALGESDGELALKGKLDQEQYASQKASNTRGFKF